MEIVGRLPVALVALIRAVHIFSGHKHFIAEIAVTVLYVRVVVVPH